MNSTDEDIAVINEILRGSNEAYAKLVTKYQGKVRRFCMNMLCNAEDADDAAQEIFIKIYRSLKTFQGTASFSSWIYRISANHCKDLLKKRNNRKEQSWDALLETDRTKFEALCSVSENVALPIEHQEMVATLLAALPIEQREVFVLREVDGMTYEEICTTLDCTIDSVKGRLKRARERMLELAISLNIDGAATSKERRL